MSVPDFMIWHCAGCGAPAEGKKKPCNCVTNVGMRDGPRGKREQTWWDDPLPEMPRVLYELVGAVGLYLGRIGPAHEGDKARLERALDRAMADAEVQYQKPAL
jgi:hypothetical protein